MVLRSEVAIERSVVHGAALGVAVGSAAPRFNSSRATTPPYINPAAIGKPYAGRDSAVSTDAPNGFQGKHIATVRHHSTGEKYAFGKQIYGWKAPWNLPQRYMHEPDVEFEKLTGPMVTPKWQQTEQFKLLGQYGEATPEFKDAMSVILTNDPEAIFPDPGNPLLKQLLTSKAKRDGPKHTAPSQISRRSPQMKDGEPHYKVCHITGALKPNKEVVKAPKLKDTFVAPRSALTGTSSRSGPITAPTCNPLSNEPAAWADGVWQETPLGIIAADEREFRKQFQLEKT